MEADCDDDLKTSPIRPYDEVKKQIPTSAPASKTVTNHNMTVFADLTILSVAMVFIRDLAIRLNGRRLRTSAMLIAMRAWG